MQREVLKHLENARLSAEKIARFAKTLTETDFLALDAITRDGVYMNFSIIGESLNSAVRLEPSLENQISEIWRIIGFRHQIVHGYFALKHTVTWRTIDEKLPILIRELSILLDNV